MEPSPQPPPPDPADRRGGGRIGTHILAIFGLVTASVAQPIFDLLAREATFLVAHGFGRREVLGLVALLVVAVPAILAAPGVLLLRLRPKLGEAYFGAVAGLLAVPLALAAARRLPAAEGVHPAAWLALAAVVALGVAALYVRRGEARLFAAVLAVGVLVAPIWFLGQPSLRRLMTADVDPGAHAGADVQTPVVMIVFDELPLASLMDGDGNLLEKRFPSFARLARTSHWLRNATTVSDHTHYALPAIVTGRYPSFGQLPAYWDHPRSLFTLLGSSHRIHAVEVVSRLCPPTLCSDPGNGQDGGQDGGGDPGTGWGALLADLGVLYLRFTWPAALADAAGVPDVTSAWRGFGEGAQTRHDLFHADLPPSLVQQSLAEFHRGLDDDDPRPGLHVLHLLLPHMPWVYGPSGRQYAALTTERPEGTVQEFWEEDPWITLQGHQAHLLQVAYTDRELGRILDHLQSRGLFDRSLVVVTSDHGAAFLHGDNRRRVSPANHPDILGVPLFIKEPGQREGRVHDTNVESIDLLPILAGRLGIELPWPVDGTDLLAPGAQPRPRKLALDLDHERAIALDPTLDGLMAAAARTVDRFGDDLPGLYALGPRPDLLGRDLGDLSAGPVAGPAVELDHPWLFQCLDPEDPSAFLPSKVEGHLASDPEGGGIDLALAVEGRICATTRALPRRGGVRFSAMVPDSCFHAGANEVAVARIDGDRLSLLPRSDLALQLPWTLEPAADGDRLVDPSGRSLEVGQGLRGAVWKDDVGAAGWAADLDAGESADHLVVFRNGSWLATVPVDLGTPALRQRHGAPGLGASGFRLPLPETAGDSEPPLRLFAVRAGSAAEVPWVRPAP